ncbi:MAG: DUF4112 domain-containing protein [Caldilineaceae bacterium]
MTTSVSRTGNRYQRNQAVLDQVDNLAWLLDNWINIPIINYRIGLDAIIGLIPGLGDAAGLLLSSYIVLQAVRLGTPQATLMRMVLNIGIEALIGLIPVLGDFFDATFKANVRNVRLLQLAVGRQPAGRPVNKAAGKGAIALVVGALIGIILLIGGIGAALVWGLLSLFTN